MLCKRVTNFNLEMAHLVQNLPFLNQLFGINSAVSSTEIFLLRTFVLEKIHCFAITIRT